MDKRLELHEILCNILDSRNVYFQPPESVRMKYPAIVYSLNTIEGLYANNVLYNYERQYLVTLMTSDPDNSLVEKILKLQKCKIMRVFTSNNLNHYVFQIFY